MPKRYGSNGASSWRRERRPPAPGLIGEQDGLETPLAGPEETYKVRKGPRSREDPAPGPPKGAMGEVSQAAKGQSREQTRAVPPPERRHEGTDAAADADAPGRLPMKHPCTPVREPAEGAQPATERSARFVCAE